MLDDPGMLQPGKRGFSMMQGSIPRALRATGRDPRIAVRLCAAAMDGDPARVKQILADMLNCRIGHVDVDLSCELQALQEFFLVLHSLALTDELTGLYNRRGFLQKGARLLEVAAREMHTARLIYVDVDHLKSVNDSLGHEAGDRLLTRASQVLRDAAGSGAVIGRLGGDEFAVLEASTSRAGHHQTLARLQNAVDACNASAVPELSLSIGLADFDPREPVAIFSLLEHADRIMYQDKWKESRRFDRSLRAVR
jgi:diguanylate cyclase (GGDEF)-like protein